MSGGYFDYKNSSLGYELFQSLTPSYGEEGFSQANYARRINPLKDRQVSELCWDLLCLIDSCDYMLSGDISDEDYAQDLKYFKNKWLTPTSEELTKREIDLTVDELRRDLYAEFGMDKESSDN